MWPGAAAWAAGLAAATVALGEWLGERVAQPAPHGLVAGAVVAAGLTLLLARVFHVKRATDTGAGVRGALSGGPPYFLRSMRLGPIAVAQPVLLAAEGEESVPVLLAAEGEESGLPVLLAAEGEE